MPIQYEQLRIKDGDPANARTVNPRLQSLDLRIAAIEEKGLSFDAERQKLTQALVSRTDELMLPIVQRLADYASLGTILTTTSASSIEVSADLKVFVVDEGKRQQFAPSAYLAIIKTGDPTQAMLGTLSGYNAETGQLSVLVDRFAGAGFHEGWTITAASATDNAEAIPLVEAYKDAAEAAAGQATSRRNEAAAAAEAALDYRDAAEEHRDIAHAEAEAADDARNQAQIAQAATEAARDAALAFMRGHIGSFTAPTVPLNRVDGSPLQEGDWYFKRVIGPPDTFLIDYVSSVGPTVWRTLTAAADTSVTSFNGRVGGVNPVAGDYSAAMVTVAAIAGLAGTDVQAVLASVKAALDLKALASRTVTGAGLVTGGGDATANRTLTVTKSSPAQAAAGTDDDTAMTPVRTKEAILTHAPAPSAASETVPGIAELATPAETIAGLDTTRATHSAGVKAAINAAIAAITGAAPSTLDTFIEFANALGNDPNFATTVTTALSTKLPSGSFTGANILALLLGVDGTGSGLDADLLDGLHAAYFRDASNLNAGTVPSARMKAGLQDFATLHTDWNTALANGFWMGTAAANAPAALTGWVIGHVSAHNATWVTQDVWDFTAASGMLRYRRHCLNGVWGAWYVVQDTQAAQDARYPQITTSISSGTGLIGGGSFAASRTLSFDTAWGDARYALAGHSHTALDRGSRGYNASNSNTTLTAAHLDTHWVLYGASHTITVPTAASVGAGAVYGSFSCRDAILATFARSGSDAFVMPGGAGATSFTLAKGQQCYLRSDGTSVWEVLAYNNIVTLPGSGAFSAQSALVFTLPPGFDSYEFLFSELFSSPSAYFYARTSANGGGSFATGASDYRFGFDVPFNNASHQYGLTSNASAIEIRQDLPGSVVYPATIRTTVTNARNASGRTHVVTEAFGERPSITTSHWHYSAERQANEDNDAIQFYPASGTITGKVLFTGRKNS